jgi:hypothetical protein
MRPTPGDESSLNAAGDLFYGFNVTVNALVHDVYARSPYQVEVEFTGASGATVSDRDFNGL